MAEGIAVEKDARAAVDAHTSEPDRVGSGSGQDERSMTVDLAGRRSDKAESLDNVQLDGQGEANMGMEGNKVEGGIHINGEDRGQSAGKSDEEAGGRKEAEENVDENGKVGDRQENGKEADDLDEGEEDEAGAEAEAEAEAETAKKSKGKKKDTTSGGGKKRRRAAKGWSSKRASAKKAKGGLGRAGKAAVMAGLSELQRPVEAGEMVKVVAAPRAIEVEDGPGQPVVLSKVFKAAQIQVTGVEPSL